jgi:hypothetical protein
MDSGWDLAGGTARTGRAIRSGAVSDMELDITAAGPDMDITEEVFRAGVTARI